MRATALALLAACVPNHAAPDAAEPPDAGKGGAIDAAPDGSSDGGLPAVTACGGTPVALDSFFGYWGGDLEWNGSGYGFAWFSSDGVSLKRLDEAGNQLGEDLVYRPFTMWLGSPTLLWTGEEYEVISAEQDDPTPANDGTFNIRVSAAGTPIGAPVRISTETTLPPAVVIGSHVVVAFAAGTSPPLALAIYQPGKAANTVAAPVAQVNSFPSVVADGPLARVAWDNLTWRQGDAAAKPYTTATATFDPMIGTSGATFAVAYADADSDHHGAKAWIQLVDASGDPIGAPQLLSDIPARPSQVAWNGSAYVVLYTESADLQHARLIVTTLDENGVLGERFLVSDNAFGEPHSMAIGGATPAVVWGSYDGSDPTQQFALLPCVR